MSNLKTKILTVLFNPKLVIAIVAALCLTIGVYHFRLNQAQTDLKIAKTSLGIALGANQTLQTQYDTLSEVFDQYKTDHDRDQSSRDDIEAKRVEALIHEYETQIDALKALLKRQDRGETIHPSEVDEVTKPLNERKVKIEYEALFKTHCLYVKADGCLE